MNTITQPINDNIAIVAAISGSSMCQTTAGIGRHCQNSRSNVRLANST